ncbi:MAG: bifunctional oligoribonuclease/PAP phosphatase NrnA [Clostridiales bacterium]|nr:bifunctional oligoribonuclease/PAP phosphatase NrnA [Clostridiales bacterium]
MLQKIISALKESRNVLLTGHLTPDGDCVGSMLGLYLAFDGESKGWQMVLADPPPYYTDFLPAAEKIVTPDKINGRPGLVVMLDCAETARAGKEWLAPLLEQAELIVIDHHPGTAPAAKLSYSDSGAAATAELLCRLLEEAGMTPGEDAALCLYTALAFDTGGFRFANTTWRTMLAASRLLALGIDGQKANANLFERRSLAGTYMLGVALSGLEIFCGGRLAAMTIDRASIVKHGARPDDCSNIISMGLSVEGVKAALLFEEREGSVKLSLRCRKGYAINGIARALGGGGHELAAGAVVEGDLASVKERALALTREMLEKAAAK